MGPYPIQLVVVMAVRNAVSAEGQILVICRLLLVICSLQITKRSLQISVRRLYRNSPSLGLYIT